MEAGHGHVSDRFDSVFFEEVGDLLIDDLRGEVIGGDWKMSWKPEW